ncbi:hypothetical protein ACOKR8_13155 [Vibrio cholerae]
MKKIIKVHTLMQRINRQLDKQEQILRKVNPNNQSAVRDLGEFYIESFHGSIETHVHLEELAKKLNCIRPSEQIED